MDFASIVDWFAQESMNAAEQTNDEAACLPRPPLSIRWTALDLARASKVGVATIRRAEVVDGLSAQHSKPLGLISSRITGEGKGCAISQHHESQLRGLRHGFGPTVCIELGEYRSDMKFGGVERNAQATGDRLV